MLWLYRKKTLSQRSLKVLTLCTKIHSKSGVRENQYSDDLICLFVRSFFKGFKSDDGEVEIPPHKASSTKTMFSHLRKYLENEVKFTISGHGLKVIYDYMDTKEKKQPSNQAKTFSMEEIQNLFRIEPTTLTQIRDKLVFVFGVCALLRSSELHELKVEDVEPRSDGIVLTVHRKKVPVSRQTQTLWINNVFYGWDVVSNLNKYLDVIPLKGALWRSVAPHQKRRLDSKRFGKKKIDEIPKKMADLLKIDPDLFRSHSMRRTGASLMAANGSTDEQIKSMGNWTSSTVAHRYVHTSAFSMQKNAKTIAMPEVLYPDAEMEAKKVVPSGDPPVIEESDVVLHRSRGPDDAVDPPAQTRKRMRCGSIIFSGPIHKLVVVNGSSELGDTQSQPPF